MGFAEKPTQYGHITSFLKASKVKLQKEAHSNLSSSSK
jgi:hypothetical protein